MNTKYLGMRLAGSAFVFALAISPAPGQNQESLRSKKTENVYAELAKAPTKAVARRNPMAGNPDAVAAGEKLFALHCAECHGEMAEGGRHAPSLLADEVQRATSGTIFWILTNGVVRHGMPVWSKLPEPQRWQLVSYIKSFTPARKSPQ